nr:glycosyltransferase family 4 protein [Pseudoalteromonas sp. NEC-BIFX-2020_002]
MLFTESQRRTYTSSYRDKEIFYRETFIKPNAKLFPETIVTKRKQFTFCYIAHSVWLKGLTVLLDAWKESRPAGAKLLIGGNIESGLKKSIEEKYRDIEGVEFLGRVEDLNLFFRESHVCVVPSLLDAGPATVAESLSCGTPVICSDGCGSSTLVTGPFGQVFKSGSDKALAKALNELSSNYGNYSFTSQDFAAVSARIDESEFHTAAATHILEGVK